MLKEFMEYNFNIIYKIKIFMAVIETIIFFIGLLYESESWTLIIFIIIFVPFANLYWSRSTYDTLRNEVGLKISFQLYDFLSLLFLVGFIFITIDMAINNFPTY